MSTRNRERVARDGLEVVVKMTRDYAGDLELAKASTGHFFNYQKHTINITVCTILVICLGAVVCLVVKASNSGSESPGFES